MPVEFLSVNCSGVNREKLNTRCTGSVLVEAVAFENLGLMSSNSHR